VISDLARHSSRRRNQLAAPAARATSLDIDLIEGHRGGRLRFASLESGADATVEAEAQAAREMDMAAVVSCRMCGGCLCSGRVRTARAGAGLRALEPCRARAGDGRGD
jgi:hypothetical protein